MTENMVYKVIQMSFINVKSNSFS